MSDTQPKLIEIPGALPDDGLPLPNWDVVSESVEAEHHRRHWSEHGLQSFWFGQSFQQDDDGVALSYSLSQVIVRNMMSRSRDDFIEFIRKAVGPDCGDQASQSVYGVGIADWAGQFLGPGDWEPRIETAEQFFARAEIYLRRNDIPKALEDMRMTIQLEPGNTHFANGLAWTLATCPAPEFRNGREARDLAEKSCELTDWKDEPLLDTLAASHAECGDFEKAVECQEMALALVPEWEKQESLQRLAMYKERRPYREAN